MIDQVSARTKAVILAHFVAQEGGQSYLHLGRVSAQRAAGALHTLQNESFETVVEKFPGSIVVCDYALPPRDLDGETGGAERAEVTVTTLPAKKDLDHLSLSWSLYFLSSTKTKTLSRRRSWKAMPTLKIIYCYDGKMVMKVLEQTCIASPARA
ncbi:hypothetical protein ABVK25_005498 [Lepraria finkii]|uniref:Uncharacterized protein n=1 Tax=Lepraria finkii TaxID=1340010 RepID=A0ABR4B940_9LECA